MAVDHGDGVRGHPATADRTGGLVFFRMFFLALQAVQVGPRPLRAGARFRRLHLCGTVTAGWVDPEKSVGQEKSGVGILR